MNIVILDGRTTNPGDVHWDSITSLGNTTIYPFTKEEDVLPRLLHAEIVVTNKVQLHKNSIDQLPELKCICLLATGFDNVDLQRCREKSISVFNAKNYSSSSVAQHVFACILHGIHRIDLHNLSIKRGEWSNQPDFSYHLSNLTELNGKTLGIFGFGRIGQMVGRIGHAFGMQIISYHKHPQRDSQEWVKFVDKETLLKKADFLTLHAPLNKETQYFINNATLDKMKSSSILINTGRGGLIHENDLANALINKKIAFAHLDVMEEEPPPLNHRFYEIENCFLTPHQAWASKESRQRLIQIVANNINKYQKGNLADSLSK